MPLSTSQIVVLSTTTIPVNLPLQGAEKQVSSSCAKYQSKLIQQHADIIIAYAGNFEQSAPFRIWHHHLFLEWVPKNIALKTKRLFCLKLLSIFRRIGKINKKWDFSKVYFDWIEFCDQVYICIYFRVKQMVKSCKTIYAYN